MTRQFLRAAAGAGFFLLAIAAALPGSAQTQPVSGMPVSTFAPVDTIMQNLMTQYAVPGAAVAITYNGHLVYARGYGFAETATNAPTQPDTIMRIASNSKPMTAAAIQKLIEGGKLTLSTTPFTGILKDLTPPAGETEDPRFNQITIQDLLDHEGGFDDTEDPPDPAFADEVAAAQAFGGNPPATPEQLIRYEMGKPLDHDPGTVYAYSNLGYIILGYIVERVGGAATYQDYMENTIFTPVGLDRIQPGQTFLDQQWPTEAAYYDYPGAPLAQNVYDPSGAEVPFPYGGYSVPLNNANGGWVVSAIDLARWANIMNGTITPGILSNPPNSFANNYLYIPPYGQGWYWTFFGSLPGTNSLISLDTALQNYPGRVIYSAVFNSRQGYGTNIEEPEGDAVNQITAALEKVTSWPTNDMFTIYKGTASSCKWSLASTSSSVAAAATTGSVAATDANYCAWYATSNTSWLHITASAGPNSNNATVSYKVDANTGAARTGTLTIAGLTYTVKQAAPVAAATTTTVTASPTSIAYGGTVKFTATVKKTSGSGSPTGTVTFKSGSTTLGTGTLSSGTATLSAAIKLAPGSQTITAAYGGDSGDTASSGTVALTVTKDATSTTLTASPTSFTSGTTVKLTATVKATSGAGTPTGTITFKNGSTTLGTGTLSSGTATLSTAISGSAGALTITASYGGDANDATSSGTASVSIATATTTTLAISPTTVVSGSSASVTITVKGTGSTPTGTATLWANGVDLGGVALSNGTVKFNASSSGYPAGTYPVYAQYNGDSTHAASKSNTVNVTITK